MVVLACCAAGARAEGLNFTWDGCAPAGGTQNHQLACTSNLGFETLYASFVAPAGVVRAEALVLTVDLFSDTGLIQDWWTFRNVGSCRNGALTVNTFFAGDPGCTDLWLGAETTRTIVWTRYYNGALDHGRLVVTAALTDTTAFVTAEPGIEYHALKYQIVNTRTTGSGACAGCLDPACLILSSLRIVQYKGASDIEITSEASSRTATWQGSVSGACQQVPVRNQTWGGIKSLYR